MKVGDIVAVTDASFSMLYDGGKLRHASGARLSGRLWKVLAIGLIAPVYTGGCPPGGSTHARGQRRHARIQHAPQRQQRHLLALTERRQASAVDL